MTHEVQDPKEAQEEYKITVDTTGYRPELDPSNPAFDAEAYKKIVATWTNSGIKEMLEKQKQAYNRMAGELSKVLAGEMRTTADAAKVAIETVTTFLKSDYFQSLKDGVAALSTYYNAHKEEIEALADISDDARELVPFLKAELEDLKQDPAFSDVTIADLFAVGFDADGNVTDSPFKQAIERAKQRREEFQTAEETIINFEQAAENLPRIISNPTDLLSYPLDKPNSYIWNLLEDAEGNGQLALELDTRKKGTNKDALIYYGISFDELETGLTITKQLTPFDKRVYIAAAALFNGGNDVVSISQIHKMMGNSRRPSEEQTRKISDSLTKMGAARVYIDSTEEVKTNKKYTAFKYDAALLPFERISAYINNTMTEAAIHLFREPPLITFARERGQITSLTRQLLESPISKTDTNLRLEDYLLERIGHMKNPRSKAPRKMLFTTIYERCHITGKTEKDRKERQRTPGKICKYLDHYVKCGYISGYDMGKDSVTIRL